MMLSALLLISYTHMYNQDFSSFGPKLELCPPYTTTITPVSDVSACVCIPGYYPFDNTCAPCSANFYKPTAGNHSCTQCQSNSLALPASTKPEHCLCKFGFTSGGNNDCVACAQNQYKNFLGSAPCLHCPDNSNSPVNTQRETDCTCNAGYEKNQLGNCSYCAPGQFKNVSSHEQCFVCPPNTFSSNFGQTQCTSCPPNALNPNYGSNTLYDCLCTPGYEFKNDQCETCAADHYCAGQNAKQPCPMHSVSSQGSTNIQQCHCVGGYFRNASSYVCHACPPGFYCPYQTETPIACPEHASSAPRSSSENDCICLPGYDDQIVGV